MMPLIRGKEQLASRPTYIKVDVNALQHNVGVVRNYIGSGCGIMAVVKSDAYCHGLEASCTAFAKAGVDSFGVLRLQTAYEMRQAGVTQPILMMGSVAPDDFPMASELDLTVGVVDFSRFEDLQTYAKSASKLFKIHLKVDTGMHRLGIGYNDLLENVDRLSQLADYEIAGVYSHLANADNLRDDFAFVQLQRFREVASAVEQYLGKRVVQHIANSDGVFRHKDFHLDMVRPGIALYGYNKRAPQGLQPAMTIESKIWQLKALRAGECVGYDRQFEATTDRLIAVMPIGYADGYKFGYSGHSAIVRGQLAPTVGRICMDLLMVDVTQIEGVKLGDVVTFLGRQEDKTISLFDLARRCGTTHYEVLTSMSTRLPRIYEGDL